MNSLRETLRRYHQDILNSGNPHFQSWALVRDPLPIVVLCLSYAYLVAYLGPALMRNRKPFRIKWIVVGYDIFMSGANMCLFVKLFSMMRAKPNLLCMPYEESELRPELVQEALVSWWFMIMKIVEFFDSIFFVLTKKNHLLTPLHLMHHGLAPLSTWIGVKYCPNGHAIFICTANSLIHVIMYGYYALAALGPEWRSFLWWKRYLTRLQMVQFVVAFAHSLVAVFLECQVPKICLSIIFANTVVFLLLFLHFYLTNYTAGQKSSIKTH